MIRVMTYNIRGGLGMDGRRSARRIAEVIRESGAQVVCLQEVHQRLPWSRMSDQPKLFVRYLAMEVLFRRNLSIGIGGFGNAILSSLPTESTAHHPLTSRGERRGVLEARFATQEGPLTVFCTHLGLNADERVAQARELAGLVNACAGPAVVCGDFNEESGGIAVSELLSSAGLIDSAPDGPPTFSSDNPTSRIDMILCAPGVRACSVTVLDSHASDHLPVAADLQLALA